jgi:hypothetical protein
MAGLFLIISPFFALVGAFFRALFLCIPTMWVLNWTHNYIPLVPALPLAATFLLIMLIGLLFGGLNTESE